MAAWFVTGGMATFRSTVYCMLCLAVMLVLVQLAHAQAEPLNKFDPVRSLGLGIILVTVLSVMLVVTMCLALG